MRRDRIAVQLLDDACPSATAWRLGRRIIDRAVFTGGTTTLTRNTVQNLGEVSTWRSARKLLQACSAAGIEWISPNEDTVSITVKALIEPIVFPAQNGPEEEETGLTVVQNGPETEEFRDSSRARVRSGRQVGDHKLENDIPTYLPTNTDEDLTWSLSGPGTKHEQFTARKLLIDPDVGLDASSAKQIAGKYSLEAVRRAVQKFVTGKIAGTYHSPGILIEWLIRQPGLYSFPFLSDEFQQSALYLRHLTKPEEAAHQTAEIEAQALADAYVEHGKTVQAGPALLGTLQATGGIVGAFARLWQAGLDMANDPYLNTSPDVRLARYCRNLTRVTGDGEKLTLYFDDQFDQRVINFKWQIERGLKINGINNPSVFIHVDPDNSKRGRLSAPLSHTNS